MGKRKNIIPTRDEDFDLFQKKFYDTVGLHLSPSPPPPNSDWGIPQEAYFGELSPPKTEWDSAWAVAKDKDNRTRTQVLRKSRARKAYEKALRKFIKEWIRYNAMMTDEDRKSIGIPPVDTTRTPVPVPTTVPEVEILPGNGAQLIIRFKQQSGEEGTSRDRAKPFGVARMDIRYKVGTPAPANVAACPLSDSAQRNPKRITFDESQTGLRVYFFFRWVNSRNQGGPWTGTPQSGAIPG